jgi:tetratricopeptide (TPR) repeat protein
MKTDALIRIVLIVALLVVGVVVNLNLTNSFWQQEEVALAARRGPVWGGLSRFMSHLNWMRLLQYRAVNAGQRDDEVAEALYRRYDLITDQDPYLVMAYEHGGLELATMGRPDLALKLLEKGIEATGKTNWRLPTYAGHVCMFYLPQKNPQRAEGYYRQAQQVSGHPFYVESTLVRLNKQSDDPLEMARLWQTIATPSQHLGPVPTSMPEQMLQGQGVGYTDQVGYSPRVVDEIIALLRQVRQQAEKAEGEKKTQLNEQAEQIESIIKSMIPGDQLCSYCFTEYAAGDKFCAHCGREVEVFNVCPQCGAQVERDDQYCGQCGQKLSAERNKNKP